ncbi:CHASE2 domain-containing protein [Brasilonema sp. CT11]|nr:CHASE2 domain-containing protein [Brasilonema sp. CT11]
MKFNSHFLHLKVQKVEKICLFALSWGQGQNLSVQINYPTVLSSLYEEWRRAYLNFYQSEQMRGRAISGGIATIKVDWHAELVKAETKFMFEFHRWLRSAELYEIRAQIAKLSQEFVKANPQTTETVQLFLTCAPLELARFPWEAWEFGTEFATTGTIRIIRAPLNIATESPSQYTRPQRRRARILAILGDDTGLNFEADRQAVRSLSRIADIQFVGWQPKQTPQQAIQQITKAITDQQGWDILFFAGHSNETQMTGGELGIAPGMSISISEIRSQLIAAKKLGLQVAIFNSCSGLSLADALIDIGFSQVVVMREPIHNCVAQEFLVRFLQGLAKHLDVYESMMAARQFLRMEKSHTYPSASLVPSLFCYPGSALFRINRGKLPKKLYDLLPKPIEAIALCTSIVLSCIPPVAGQLLNGRTFVQSIYRDATVQVPSEEDPPVALVEIDTESISHGRISQLNPINRSYLAKLIERLQKLNASVVGLDVVLDTPQKDPPSGDQDLAKAVQQAVDQNTWLIIAGILESGRELSISKATAIASENWTVQGYIDVVDPHFVEIPLPDQDCRQACPMAYLMSLVHTSRSSILDLPRLDTSKISLRTQLLSAIEQIAPKIRDLPPPLNWYPPFGLQPIVDFSLPPDRVYQRIPAWKLLEDPEINKSPLLSQVVLIAVGSDERLGIAPGKADRFDAPAAMRYWTQQSQLTGGESLAYMTHHFLRRHFVIPIPDFWVIGVAVILGKITVLLLKRQQFSMSPTRRLQIRTAAIGATAVYGVIGLQLYIWASVLLPWLLPSLVFLAYVLPATRREKDV